MKIMSVLLIPPYFVAECCCWYWLLQHLMKRGIKGVGQVVIWWGWENLRNKTNGFIKHILLLVLL